MKDRRLVRDSICPYCGECFHYLGIASHRAACRRKKDRANNNLKKNYMSKIKVKSTDYRDISALYMKVFGMKLSECVDELSMRFKIVKIDLGKFEEKIQELHPYDPELYSLSEIVEKHYGAKGLTLIEILL